MKNIILGLLLCIFSLSTYAYDEGDVFKGKVSYYSARLHGHNTSSGERYHKDSLTCAHLTLPFGTRLKVKNLANDKEVIVRVTDRGPHTKKYVLDLSNKAAEELGFMRHGWANTEITVLGLGEVYKSSKSSKSSNKNSKKNKETNNKKDSKKSDKKSSHKSKKDSKKSDKKSSHKSKKSHKSSKKK